MTLFGLLASLAWTASAVLFVERLSRFAHRWLDAITSARAEHTPVVIPDDLEALVSEEQGSSVDQTALIQDQLRTAILERYAKLKDWNKVRRAMGLGAMTEAMT
jgi:hypothetical protein